MVYDTDSVHINPVIDYGKLYTSISTRQSSMSMTITHVWGFTYLQNYHIITIIAYSYVYTNTNSVLCYTYIILMVCTGAT